MANAVLVTDMLRGFMEEDNPLYCGAKARRIIPNIQALLTWPIDLQGATAGKNAFCHL